MLVRQYFIFFAIGAPILLLILYAFWSPAIWLLVLVAPVIWRQVGISCGKLEQGILVVEQRMVHSARNFSRNQPLLML